MSHALGQTLNASRRYALASHVYACRLPTGTVFIDLHRNRYSGLPAGTAAEIFDYLANDHASDETLLPDPVRELIDVGLIHRTASGDRPFDASGIDLRRSLLAISDAPTATVRPSLHDIARFCWCNALTRHALRSRSLYDIACEMHAVKNRLRPLTRTTTAQLARLVRVFRRLRPFAFAAHDRCLFHALTLWRFLAAYGLSSTWVVGVRLRPWGAHSWVQHEGWLLDAAPEVVREFTPIVSV